MWIRLNGKHRQFAAGSTLRDVLGEHGTLSQGIAVALDGAIVPRAAWSDTQVPHDASVEIVTATAGG